MCVLGVVGGGVAGLSGVAARVAGVVAWVIGVVAGLAAGTKVQKGKIPMGTGVGGLAVTDGTGTGEVREFVQTQELLQV